MIKEKIKKFFNNNTKENKKTENLVVLLIILVIAVITINIFLSDKKEVPKENTSGKELAVNNDQDFKENDMEKRLEVILSQIKGVGDVNVLITYSESSSIVPLYNESNSTSTTEEVDTNGGTRTIESYNVDKEVINGNDSEPVTEKLIMPKIEGAIITAKGASNSEVKSNIISAVEAVTGIATHKIQVFEMK